MQLDEFLEPRVLIVSGKGGVGKTTVAAALALVAARHGRTACIAEVDRKGSLPRAFDAPVLSYQPKEMSPGVYGMNIVPEEALGEYLDVQYHMKRISRIFTSTHFVDYITTAAPGLKDILTLGKIWYLEQDRNSRFDTIIVDAPAAGHMLTFLSAPMGLSDALRVGPVQRQAQWLLEMLRDPLRSRVHLVTLPEEMPVVETMETSIALQARVGITSGAVFANGVYSPLLSKKESAALVELIASGDLTTLATEAKAAGLNLDDDDMNAIVGYARFLEARRAIQASHLRILKKGVVEPVVELPFLFSAGLALPDIENLADVVEEEIAEL